MMGYVACMGETGNVIYMTLVGKPDQKKPLRLQGHIWESNIKMDLK
jgi:hypothetical protein